MSFAEKVKSFVTGKNETERLQERAANKEIRRKQLGAYYKARQEESIKYAQKRAAFESEQQLKKLKNRYAMQQQSYHSPFGGGGGGGGMGGGSYSIFSGGFSKPVAYRPMNRPARRVRRRGRARTRTVYRNAPQTYQRHSIF